MVRPRRLSDSSVGSACSDSESNASSINMIARHSVRNSDSDLEGEKNITKQN